VEEEAKEPLIRTGKKEKGSIFFAKKRSSIRRKKQGSMRQRKRKNISTILAGNGGRPKYKRQEL